VILFFEHGRLGNQLFQYCGLRHYCSEHKLVFIGCEDLQRHFNSVDARFIPKNTLSRWFPFSLFRRIVFFLVAVRLLGRITEEKDGEVFKLAIRKGLFWNAYVAQNVFFQHRDVVDQIRSAPSLKPDLIQVVLDWLKQKGIDPNSCSLVFVHIRRGDYLHWPSDEFPAVLDLAWHKRSMKAMQEKSKNPVFVLMGNDRFYLHDVFNESDGLVISDNPPEIDMALMSLCHSGILSASSFAWWGAFYARSNQQEGGTFLAPQYWGGHRVKKWYPTHFRTNWITYFE
jgi:hypothetical protein